jgi:hypothetical protein
LRGRLHCSLALEAASTKGGFVASGFRRRTRTQRVAALSVFGGVDLAAHERGAVLPAASLRAEGAAFSPDGSLVAMSNHDGTLSFYGAHDA